MSMREHAESLARQGFRVLPLHTPIFNALAEIYLCSCRQAECKSIGKHPRNKQGLTEATTDLERVGEWWSMWPDANIGVATGYEFDVIDIDGPDGLKLYDDYCARFGVPMQQRGALTGRYFGTHIYVKPGGQKAWTGGFAGHPVGLDVKGKGGYVVAPPSLHETGNRYGWTLEGDDVRGETPWPEWHAKVVEHVSPVRIRQPSTTGGSGIGFAATVKERIRSDVAGTPEGGRWQALQTVGTWGLAGLVKGGEIGQPEALVILEELAAELRLDAREIGRLPDELQRAVENRRDPIQRRAVPETPSYVSSLVSEPLSGPNPALDDADRERLAVESQTAYYRVQMQARDAARDQLRREKLDVSPDDVQDFTLDEFLALPIEAARYRLDGLWPVGGRIMLAAQFKAGKTTMVGNLVRSLADGSAFLNRFGSIPPDGTVGIVDTEMSPRMIQTWLRDQAVANTHKVWLAPIRGKAHKFEITDDYVRSLWAQRFKQRDTEILLLDCLGPVLAGLGFDENNNQEVGKFISAFEALLSEAGIEDAMIVHHMGHVGERSRGASRLRDWPDVEWHLIREGQEEENADAAPNALRFFRAYGRDVSIPEQLLHYDSEFRWLSVNGDGSRKNVRENRIAVAVEAYVKENPGCTQNAIEAAVTGRAVNVRSSLRALVDSSTVVTVDGPNKAKLHFHRDYEP
jgi:Bifunctional DNA primase/polymerase, N-terminal/AAA domain